MFVAAVYDRRPLLKKDFGDHRPPLQDFAISLVDLDG